MNYYQKIKSFFFGSIEKGLTRDKSLIAIYGYFWGLMDLSTEKEQIEIEKSYNQINKEIYREDY